ncbi:MAG: peptidylprolyl isomerase [Flavobacteriales bacterium]|nr:peptidylprolyl isomerase [Flavobacteriales bacterium]
MNWVKRQQRRLAVTCTILWSLSATTGVLAQRGAATTRPLVEIRTTFGTMVVALYNETPQHRDNFLELVRNGAYDSLLFHRVVPSLMIQGGDPDSRRAGLDATLGTGDPGYSLPAEIVPGLFHKKGALAAAPLSEQAGTEGRTHGSQFYIVHGKTFQPQELDLLAKRNARLGTPVNYTADQRETYAKEGGAPHLDGGYTVFGEVVEGLEVIDALAALPCDTRDRPLKEVRIFMRVLP